MAPCITDLLTFMTGSTVKQTGFWEAYKRPCQPSQSRQLHEDLTASGRLTAILNLFLHDSIQFNVISMVFFLLIAAPEILWHHDFFSSGIFIKV